MSTSTAEKPEALDEVMLAMDVADTLGRLDAPAAKGLDAPTRERQLIERLRAIYTEQGIAVSDRILMDGLKAREEARFVYAPPRRGLGVALARLYVGRARWGRWGLGAVAALVLALGGYFFGYRPYALSQAEQVRIELTRTLPGEMDALYQNIYDETKVQTAANEALQWRARGRAAAARGDRAGAEAAVARLTMLRDRLRQEYTLMIVDEDRAKPAFWSFPKSNNEATNYYIVVQAIGPDGSRLSLPVRDSESGETETVSRWGLRVPESVYESVSADKRDDGIIQHNIVGLKQFGFIELDYLVPVLGGAVTRW
jgi:hypothetical protein